MVKSSEWKVIIFYDRNFCTFVLTTGIFVFQELMIYTFVIVDHRKMTNEPSLNVWLKPPVLICISHECTKFLSCYIQVVLNLKIYFIGSRYSSWRLYLLHILAFIRKMEPLEGNTIMFLKRKVTFYWDKLTFVYNSGVMKATSVEIDSFCWINPRNIWAHL